MALHAPYREHPKEWSIDVEELQTRCVVPASSLAAQQEPLRAYHERQNALLQDLRRLPGGGGEQPDRHATKSQAARQERATRVAIQLSFGANVLLFVVKWIAVYLSGSLAVLASALDSALDLFSGSLMFFTMRAINRRQPFKYPMGKARLEPVGVMLFSAVMGVSMLGLIREALGTLLLGAPPPGADLALDLPTVLILLGSVGVKLGLWALCAKANQQHPSSSVEAYAQDHRNDVLTNAVSLVGAAVAAKVDGAWWADPLACILLSVYVVASWAQTAREQAKLLVGRAAPADVLSKITFAAFNHDPLVVKIDTVRAFHFGEQLLVEVHLVLPPEMPLRVAHDIGESLELRLEQLGEVQRAFVHLDYEWLHKPEHAVLC